MKKLRLLKIMIVLFIMTCCLFSYVYAADPTGDIIGDANHFLHPDNGTNETFISEEEMQTFSGKIFSILTILGGILAVIVGIILGIQYLFSSVEEKAKSKQNLVVYVIGCMVLFGAYGIWTIVIEIFNLF